MRNVTLHLIGKLCLICGSLYVYSTAETLKLLLS